MKYLLSIIFLFVGFTQNNENIIYWSENSRLEWKDFKGPPKSNPNHKAQTISGLLTATKISRDTLTLTARCAFDRTKSWVQKGAETDLILEHEQLHFDITELLCRRVKKIVTEKGRFKSQTAQTELSSLINNATIQSTKEQNLYDRESYPSVDKQNEWKIKVAQELESLSAFQGNIVKVILTN